MTVHPILPHVLHIEEDYRVYCTLVKGRDRAILWDTGQGKQDLRAWVEAQVETECLVLNSHGHADHIGGNHRFSAVYAHEADYPLLYAQALALHGTPPAYEVRPLEPGQVFDLGSLRARVVPLMGHTRGSVGLLLEEERLLLAGDALGPTLLLLGQEAAPLSQLRETLQEVEALPFDRFLSSHGPAPLEQRVVRAHLEHLSHPAFRPMPGNGRVLRSQSRGSQGRSVLYVSQGVLGRERGVMR